VVRFFPDETQLASTGDDGTIRIWEIGSAQQTRMLQHPRDDSKGVRWIRALDVSPDGKLLASSSMDDTVRIWEIDTGRERVKLPGHGRGGWRSLRFTKDGQRLVSWGDDMHVNVWNVATGKAISEFRAQPSGIELPRAGEAPNPFRPGGGGFPLEGGTLSADASRLLVLAANMHVFDIASGKETAVHDRTVGTHSGLAISPDNRYTVELSWGRGRGIPLADGRTVFTRERDHLVHLRKLDNGELVAELKLPDGGAGVAAFSPDGRRVAITINDTNPRVAILSVPELKEIARIEGLPGRAHAVEFSHSGKLLAVSNADTTVVVYDLEKLPQRN
jgi:WD40 repeat protein